MPKGGKSNKPSNGSPKGKPKGPAREVSKGGSKSSFSGQSSSGSKPAKRPATSSRLTAFQILQQQLKWVDIIFEVLDGRAPYSSRHPKHDEIFGNKPRLIFITKDDLADPKLTKEWAKRFSSESQKAIVLCLKDRRRQPEVVNLALELSQEKLKQIESKGLLPRPVRICVVGMPNTGKSSLINWLIGKKQVKVADRPGVTRGPQWIRVHPKLELLDTPGILPPSISNRNVGEKLGVFNLAPAGAYSREELADRAILEIQKRYPGMIERYLPKSAEEEGESIPLELMKPSHMDDEEFAEPNWKLERDRTIFSQSKRNRRSGVDSNVDEEVDEDAEEVGGTDNTDGPEELFADQSDFIIEKMNLQLIAERKNYLTTKGRPDTARAAAVFLGDVRTGKLGRITLDTPDNS